MQFANKLSKIFRLRATERTRTVLEREAGDRAPGQRVREWGAVALEMIKTNLFDVRRT